MAVGWFGEDIWDAVTSAVDAVADVATSAIDVIPGGSELRGALNDLIEGPLRDFARSPVGVTIFRAMATSIYGPLAWTLGPQLATVVWTLPGLARGESFWKSWFDEVRWRAQKTAEYFGGDAAKHIVPWIDAAKQGLLSMFPNGLPVELRALGEKAVDDLAARLRVDQWTAAMAAAALGWMPVPKNEDFNPRTGQRITLADLLRSTTVQEAAAGSLYARYGNTGVPRETAVSSTMAYTPSWAIPAAEPPIRADAPPVLEPVSSSAAARRGQGDAMLAVTIVAAAGALFWWYRSEYGPR